jgi:hypothetical protein
VIIGEVFGMHHQLGGSTEDEMNKMSVIGHFFLLLNHTLNVCGLEEPMQCFLIFVPCDNHNRLLNKYTVTIICILQISLVCGNT